MIPKRTVTLAAYARAIRVHEPQEVIADALAIDTAARLKEQILAGLQRSPLDPDDARELSELLLGGAR